MQNSFLNNFLKNWKSNGVYFDTLRVMASLSRLFSESKIPYIDYRLTENIFCQKFNALNDARDCTAYDARIGNLGIGIKTFTLKNDGSTEKIAEFNKLSKQLKKISGKDLAIKIALFRNERIDLANRTYNTNEAIYHIIGRKERKLVVFNSPYEKIDIDKIKLEKD